MHPSAGLGATDLKLPCVKKKDHAKPRSRKAPKIFIFAASRLCVSKKRPETGFYSLPAGRCTSFAQPEIPMRYLTANKNTRLGFILVRNVSGSSDGRKTFATEVTEVTEVTEITEITEITEGREE